MSNKPSKLPPYRVVWGQSIKNSPDASSVITITEPFHFRQTANARYEEILAREDCAWVELLTPAENGPQAPAKNQAEAGYLSLAQVLNRPFRTGARADRIRTRR